MKYEITDTEKAQLQASDDLDHAQEKLSFINNAINFKKLHKLTSTDGLYYILDDICQTMERSSKALTLGTKQKQPLKMVV